MVQHPFEDPNWYHAITLTERIASWHSVPCPPPLIERNIDRASQRMRKWRSQLPFRTDPYFTQRLAMDGITEDELLSLLSEPVEAVQGRFLTPPAWLAAFVQAFSSPAASQWRSLPESWCGQGDLAFLNVIEPLISQGRDRMQENIRTLINTGSDLPFDPDTVEEIIFANLPGQLIGMLNRTMALELQAARLQGLLQGDTAEGRFYAFLESVCQRATALALFREYPVLARQLMTRIDQWTKFSLEFLQHLCADWKAIRTTLIPTNDPGTLVQLQRRASASHQGARTVLIARFSSGFQVVYKPWPMAVDRHFQEFLTWLNLRGHYPPFRTLTVLDRESYGWVEFVAAQSCSSVAEIRRFYQRQGGYLAILYVLGAVDFHCGNIIAAGEHPMLIDLDTLFHARMKGITPHSPDRPVGTSMTHTVMHVGLLPQRPSSNAELGKIDVSGFGGKASQLIPDYALSWEGVGTDEMRLARKRVILPKSQHRPTLKNAEVDVVDNAEVIIAAFSAVYHLLSTHQEELLSDRGPLARFAEDKVRVIVRPGRTYGLLLRDAYHPDVLRDALDRDCFFDGLWLGVEHHPHLARLILAEREDLQNGDMPIFRTLPGSRDLWTSADERITEFFDEPSMTLVQHRVQQLSDEDLNQQICFIRASLAPQTLEPEPACAHDLKHQGPEAHLVH
jgi:type 2 lantibiotic biosynthesis protein LanM